MPVPMNPATSFSPRTASAWARISSQPSEQLASMSGAWTYSRQRVMSRSTFSSSPVSGMGPGASAGKSIVVPHLSTLVVPRTRLPRRYLFIGSPVIMASASYWSSMRSGFPSGLSISRKISLGVDMALTP